MAEQDKKDSKKEPKWYVAHTYSGYENKVKANIEKAIENREMEELILDVRVPTEMVQETKNGVTKMVQKKLFPGYVLVNMVLNDDTWYVVRNTRGVTGFVGPGSKPVPLSAEELRSLGIGGGKVEQTAKPRITVDFEKGDMAIVVTGAWNGYSGVVTDVNPQKQTVTLELELFGRPTPVELGFGAVKKKS